MSTKCESPHRSWVTLLRTGVLIVHSVDADEGKRLTEVYAIATAIYIERNSVVYKGGRYSFICRIKMFTISWTCRLKARCCTIMMVKLTANTELERRENLGQYSNV
jgi:hypothetical protein